MAFQLLLADQREYDLQALSETEMYRWVEALQEAQHAIQVKNHSTVPCTGRAVVIERGQTVEFDTFQLQRHETDSIQLRGRVKAMIVQNGPLIGAQLIRIDDESILNCTSEPVLYRRFESSDIDL